MLEDKYFPGFTQQFIETEPGVQINTWIAAMGIRRCFYCMAIRKHI